MLPYIAACIFGLCWLPEGIAPIVDPVLVGIMLPSGIALVFRILLLDYFMLLSARNRILLPFREDGYAYDRVGCECL